MQNEFSQLKFKSNDSPGFDYRSLNNNSAQYKRTGISQGGPYGANSYGLSNSKNALGNRNPISNLDSDTYSIQIVDQPQGGPIVDSSTGLQNLSQVADNMRMNHQLNSFIEKRAKTTDKFGARSKMQTPNQQYRSN